MNDPRIAETPPILDYCNPRREHSLLLLADRVVLGVVAAFVTLLALFCIVGGFYQRADWISGLIIGMVLLLIASLLWKAVGSG